MRSEHELGDFTPIRRSLMVALDGDWVAVYVWAHIRFRGQLTDGKYQATQETLMDDLVLKRDRLRRALTALRDGGWLTWERASWDDATHVYQAHDPGGETQSPECGETQSSEGGETPNSILTVRNLKNSVRTSELGTDAPDDNGGQEKAPPTVSPSAKPEREATNEQSDRTRSEATEQQGHPLTPKQPESPAKPPSRALNRQPEAEWGPDQHGVTRDELKQVLHEARTNATQSANLLAAKITENGSKPPKITEGWLVELERMHRIDGRAWAEIDGAINWSQSDDFWKANIRSPTKLRKHYDQMRLQAGREKPGRMELVSQTLTEMQNSPKSLDELLVERINNESDGSPNDARGGRAIRQPDDASGKIRPEVEGRRVG